MKARRRQHSKSSSSNKSSERTQPHLMQAVKHSLPEQQHAREEEARDSNFRPDTVQRPRLANASECVGCHGPGHSLCEGHVVRDDLLGLRPLERIIRKKIAAHTTNDACLEFLGRVRFRLRHQMDSSATGEAVGKSVRPRLLAF